MTLTELGRRNESLTVAEHAFTLDPYSAVINNWLGEARRDAGRFDDAIPAFARAIQIEPTYVYPYANIAGVQALGLDRFDIAIPWLEKAVSLDPENPVTLAWLVEAYWNLGDDAETARSLRRMLSTEPKTSYPNLVAALVNAERAGCRNRWHYHRDYDPALASIRNEPEFKAVFADIERDMAQQRARLAARPKDAPLELTAASR